MSENNDNQRNNNDRSRSTIRGPTSALTSFLREQGITVRNTGRRSRREREEAQRAAANGAAASSSQDNVVAAEGSSTTETSTTTTTTTNQVQSTEQASSSSTISLRLSSRSRLGSVLGKRKKGNNKKKKGKNDDDSDDDDDDDYDDGDNSNDGDFSLPSSSRQKPMRALVVFCSACGRRFARKEGQEDVDQCPSCISGESSSKKPPAKRKKVIARLNKTADTKIKKVPTLQDLCINVIAIYIEDVESFGFISEDSLNKLSKIISKNRKMSNEIARLFMEPKNHRLQLYDCTEMTEVALLNVAQFCPKLQELKLSYCGHMTDNVIKGYSDRLGQLKSLHLSGPYLVTKQAWIDFFKKLGPQLESLELRYSARFDLDCVKALVKHCTKLTTLKFGHITGMTSSWLDVISKLKKLTTLELAWPDDQSAFKTEDVVNYLSTAGQRLEHFSLKGGAELDDKAFTGLNHCKKLKRLYLEQASGLTSEGMVDFLKHWKNPGLEELDISKCRLFDDDVLSQVVEHSGGSLIKLNIHSLDLLSTSGLESLAGENEKSIVCRQLEEINCGFVRSIDDYVLAKMLKECPSLKKIEAWGCPLLTDTVQAKDDVAILGRELLNIYI